MLSDRCPQHIADDPTHILNRTVLNTNLILKMYLIRGETSSHLDAYSAHCTEEETGIKVLPESRPRMISGTCSALAICKLEGVD